MKRTMYVLISVVSAVVVGGCASVIPRVVQPTDARLRAQEVVALEVSTNTHADLFICNIDSSGTLNLPWGDSVEAGGRTIGEVVGNARAALAGYYECPSVRVIRLTDAVLVCGEVRYPGLYLWRKGLTLRDVMQACEITTAKYVSILRPEGRIVFPLKGSAGLAVGSGDLLLFQSTPRTGERGQLITLPGSAHYTPRDQ
jgi:hypothetical protein